MSQTGHCHCGELRYAVEGMPLSVHACHCTDCQAQSGSAFTLTMVLRGEQLRVAAGEVETRRYKLNGRDVDSHVCAACGSTVWLSSPAYPQILGLKAGTLDDTSRLKPVAHLWVSSAQPWVRLPPDAKVFQGQPTLEELMALNQGA